MADLLFRIKGDAQDAQAAFAQTQALVNQQASAIVQANERIEQSAKLSGDVVFRQLTQFRIGLTQIGRGDLGGIPNLIQGFRLAGDEVSQLTPKVATAQQTLRLLDSVFAQLGATVLSGKTIFADFQAAVSLAANGTTKEAKVLRREFEALGIDLTSAIAKPDKALRDFLILVGSGRGKVQAGNILSLGQGQVNALERAGQAIIQLEKSETAAAAAATTLSAGLSVATLTVGAFAVAAVGAVAAAIKLALSFKDSANEAQRLSDETGLTIAQVRLLQVAGTAANVEFSKIAQTFTQFRERAQKALHETGEEADKVRRLFQVLGVDAKKAASDPLTAYEDLIKKLADVQDAETRSAASKVLLGARSEDLRRLFNALNADSGALRAELESLLGSIGNNNQAVSEWNVATAKLDASWEGFKETIGASVLPVLTGLLNLIVETAKRAELLADDMQDLFAELTGRGEENVSGGIDFGFGQGPSDFANNEKDKTKAVKDALKERGKASKEARDEAAREDLRALQNQLRQLDAEYALASQRLKQRFDERLDAETTFSEKQIALAQARQQKIAAILDEEEARVNRSQLKPADQTKELQRIAQERVELTIQTSAEIEKIESDARIREQRAIERFQQEILNTLRLVGEQKIALLEEQVEREMLTNEEGQKRINAIVLAQLEQRINAQRALVNSFPEGSEQRLIEAEKLKQLELERTNATLDAERKIRASRARDLSNYRQFVSELRDLQNTTANINLDALVASRQINNLDAIRANAAIERQIINEQAAERIAVLLKQLEANAEFIAEDEAQKQQQAENERRLTALIVAENEKRTAALTLNKAKEVEAIRQQNKTFKDALSLGVDAVKLQGKAIVAGFLTGQASARQAAQAFYDALTAPLVDFLVDEGIAQSVLAARDIANLNFPGAALHTAAALALFGGAALIGAGSRAIGGAPSTAAAASGAALTGTRQDQNTIATEERFRFRESGPGKPVTTIVLVTDRQMLVKDVEFGMSASYQNDGTARKIIDNATGGRPI